MSGKVFWKVVGLVFFVLPIINGAVFMLLDRWWWLGAEVGVVGLVGVVLNLVFNGFGFKIMLLSFGDSLITVAVLNWVAIKRKWRGIELR